MSAEEAVAQTPVPGEQAQPAQPARAMFFNIAADNLSGDISDDEFARLWTLGVGSDRTLGRPSSWNGDEKIYDEFSFRFLNWLGGLPGDAGYYLEHAGKSTTAIAFATLQPREKMMARGISTAICALTGGKALNIVWNIAERQNGLEMFDGRLPSSTGRTPRTARSQC